eukprot:gene1537-2965_t
MVQILNCEEEMEDKITENVLLAQKEAEAETIRIEQLHDDSTAIQSDVLVVPQLLQFGQTGESLEDLKEKTSNLKARGQQLDLLLLKAETYSHFIRENQKKTTERLENDQDKAIQESIICKEDSRKRKIIKSSPSGSKTKKQKTDEKNEQSPQPNGRTFHQPSNLVGGTLMDYQLDGLKWLLSLWENGLSGILADEMGLGKTIQIISLIAHLREARTPGPFLIAGPLATLPNWMNEFKKWLPSCKTVLYHGSKAEREEIRSRDMTVNEQKSLAFPVVITSFEICIIDRAYLARYDWQYIILDEGHRIKNRNCRLVKELKQIPSTSRLLLTGTPIQNTLDELWSLLNFVNPMIFDDLAVFQSWFGFHGIGRQTQVDDIISTEQRQQVVSKLHEILRPFLLRRMKCDVLTDMPPKVEVVVYCGLSSLQQEYYLRLQQKTLRETLMSMGVEDAKDSSQNNLVMQLRKVCNHPFLFGEPRDESGSYIGDANPKLVINASGKFRVLDRLLTRLKSEGHKVLIFSQMTKLLDILQDYMAYREYSHHRLDGDVKVAERQRRIDNFNNDPSVFCFLLSTRAGGLGINLTAADTVVLFDSDWNPHQDSQAMARCHRVGQRKSVVIYRLITADSVEIEMLNKQISKKKLERLTIHGGDYRQAGQRSSGQLTVTRLRELLEDDVKNLARMSQTTASAPAQFTAARGIELPNEISQEEMDLICDREALFREGDDSSSKSGGDGSGSGSGKSVPREGEMYDIVAATEGNAMLMSVS